MHYLGYTYTKKVSAVYHKFKLAWSPGFLFPISDNFRKYSERGNMFAKEVNIKVGLWHLARGAQHPLRHHSESRLRALQPLPPASPGFPLARSNRGPEP